MTKNELIELLFEAYKNGSLVTPKHNPKELSKVMPKFRTVISDEVYDNLYHCLETGIEKIYEYQNSKGAYYEICLNSKYEFASSGVHEYCPFPFEGYNRIIAVYGEKRKWHIFGETSTKIEEKIKIGELINKVELV